MTVPRSRPLLSEFVFGLRDLESIIISFCLQLLASFGTEVEFIAKKLNRTLKFGWVILQVLLLIVYDGPARCHLIINQIN